MGKKLKTFIFSLLVAVSVALSAQQLERPPEDRAYFVAYGVTAEGVEVELSSHYKQMDAIQAGISWLKRVCPVVSIEKCKAKVTIRRFVDFDMT